MLLRKWRLLVAVAALVIGLIIWSLSLTPQQPFVSLQSVRINYWNVTLGQDTRGLPTGLVSMKSTVMLKIENSDSFWGYNIEGLMSMGIFLRHITSTNIMQFYEPRKTTTQLTIELQAYKVPLYGASPAVVYEDGGSFYIVYEAVLQSTTGFLPFMYKYTYTHLVTCTLTATSVGSSHSLAIASHEYCPHVILFPH